MLSEGPSPLYPLLLPVKHEVLRNSPVNVVLSFVTQPLDLSFYIMDVQTFGEPMN